MKSRLFKIFAPLFPSPRMLIPRTNVARNIIKRVFRWNSGPAMTYEEAVRKYRINDYQLQTEIIPGYLQLRRIATVMMYIAVALLTAGVVIGNGNMIMMATFSVILCAFQSVAQQYRLYIIERRKIMPFRVFLADQPAIKQIFRW